MINPTRASIGIGSNQGDRARHLFDAVAMLAQTAGVTVRNVATLLENAAVGGPADSPPFLNGAVEIETTLSPQALHRRLADIEKQLGRVRRTQWEPRVIDLDLLLFGDQIVSSQDLMVPHPLMHERRFVLQPLAEISPEARHPALGASVQQMLDNLDTRPSA